MFPASTFSSCEGEVSKQVICYSSFLRVFELLALAFSIKEDGFKNKLIIESVVIILDRK